MITIKEISHIEQLLQKQSLTFDAAWRLVTSMMRDLHQQLETKKDQATEEKLEALQRCFVELVEAAQLRNELELKTTTEKVKVTKVKADGTIVEITYAVKMRGGEEISREEVSRQTLSLQSALRE